MSSQNEIWLVMEVDYNFLVPRDFIEYETRPPAIRTVALPHKI